MHQNLQWLADYSQKENQGQDKSDYPYTIHIFPPRKGLDSARNCISMLRLLTDIGGRMATAAPNPNENGPSRMRKIMSYSVNEDIRSKLPQESGYDPPSLPPPPLNPQMAAEQNPQPASSRRPWWNSGFFPVFWTIASALSLAVNVVLCLAVLGLLSMRGPITKTVTGQSTSVLGGLYDNFVRMDQATISRTISVDANIPLNIQVPVQTRTTITLPEATQIRSPRVFIRTGGLTLDTPALVTLPKGQPLLVDLNFALPVQTTIPVHLDVPVNIPLRETELHQPFVGLQEVVRPWYCLFLPKSESIYPQTCATSAIPASTGIITP
jgi:hypothetical protein